MSARKRFQYHVLPSGDGWIIKTGGAIVDSGYTRRDSAVEVLAVWLNDWAHDYGQLSEMVLHRKDGRIGTGPSSRRTYPRASDPRGARG